MMKAYYQTDMATLYNGDCIDALRVLPDKSVQCCVTSPPYYGLRDYGTATWEGGDAACDHKERNGRNDKGRCSDDTRPGNINPSPVDTAIQFCDTCRKCGARRVDLQIGLEGTPDEYVAKMVGVFREVRRVLRDDGTVWLNLGDSYASYRDGKATPDTSRGNSNGTLVKKGEAKNRMASTFVGTPVKHKDLIGIPWRVAFALQADGWYLRQDIIWAKPNPMPESVTDRCTKAHEYIFLLSKAARYYYDAEAIKEESVDPESHNGRRKRNHQKFDGEPMSDTRIGFAKLDGQKYPTRNRRSVWTIATKPYKGAHFATFPPKLVEPCVLAGCPAGGIVLDPFAGSGTTGAVAVSHGRKFIGIELNAEYCELARKRIGDASAQVMLPM